MSIEVTLITVANRVRRFSQTDEAAIAQLCESLRRSAQIFSGRALVIGSPAETEVVSPAAITRVEIATQRNLSAYLPDKGPTTLTLIPEGAETPPAQASETDASVPVTLYFQGGDAVRLWVSGPRPAVRSERLGNLTRLFEQPVIVYALPGGGAGLINPSTLTRAVIGIGSEDLPVGAWRLNPV